jgi:hypothetical protein
LTLGFYDNFPTGIHYIENYVFKTSSVRQLQQKLIQLIAEVNRKELCFEEICSPTIPNGIVVFEFGLAEDGDFNYLSKEEARRALIYIENNQVRTLDFFCAIRYYKKSSVKFQSLKFDYYILRMLFGKGAVEFQVFHERGPIYISPQDLTEFITKGVNKKYSKKILKETTE